MVDTGCSSPFANCREAGALDFCLFHLPTWRSDYPVTLNRFYEELIASVKLADRLGWRCYRTTEHHFHYYGGAVPNPALYLTALARETQQIRLGTAVSLLPLRHPLQVAEDLASLDQFSGGRAEIGISRGFVPHEFAAFGVTREDSAERMYEGLEVIEKFWAGESFAHSGRFWSFDRVEPWPAPVQPHPSVWVAASNDRNSFEAAGRRGYNLMMNQYPMSFDSLAQKLRWYRDALSGAGHADIGTGSGGRKAMVALLTVIADTEEEAVAIGQPAVQEHVAAFGKVLAGDTWNRDFAASEAALTGSTGIDDLTTLFRERCLMTTADRAAEKIAAYRDLGFTEVAFIARFASLSAERERETIERLNRDVLPMLGAAAAAA